MAYIGKKPEDKFRGLASYDTFTGDGSTTTFDVTNILPDGGTYDVEVFVDNVRQEGGAGKSYTIGNDGNGDLKRITFAVAPDNLSEIYVINPGRNTAVVTVTDNSLTAAKLQTNAVTTAKIEDDAVTSAKIADGTIVSSNIAPGTIANDRLANSSITINGNAVSLGGSITAGTDWQAVTVADGSTQVNAVAGKGYFLDTNAGVIEVFLPTSPSRGDTIILMDYAGTFATNQVIVNTGTTNLDSTTTRQYKLTTNDTIAEFVYVDSAKGWVTRINTTTGTTPDAILTSGGSYDNPFIIATGGTVTTSGDYKIHTFTGDGTFCVSSAGRPLGSDTVDYLVVAGGGGGGQSVSADNGGGGGGGGYRESSGSASGCYTRSPLGACVSALPVSATGYPITVGAGGTKGTCGPTVAHGGDGSNSIFSTITSAGGGGGGGNAPDLNPTFPPNGRLGGSGGSGGGAGGGSNVNNSGGSGNSPPVSPPQGQAGGNSSPTAPPDGAGGGGGGATEAGVTGGSPNTNGGRGGAGATSSINGTPTARAGGGGSGSGAASPCGSGTAGASGADGPNAAANSGGGGGGNKCGSGGYTAGAGGKGIVIIRYKFQ